MTALREIVHVCVSDAVTSRVDFAPVRAVPEDSLLLGAKVSGRMSCLRKPAARTCAVGSPKSLGRKPGPVLCDVQKHLRRLLPRGEGEAGLWGSSGLSSRPRMSPAWPSARTTVPSSLA